MRTGAGDGGWDWVAEEVVDVEFMARSSLNLAAWTYRGEPLKNIERTF
jgi:hypothetical protein